MFPATVDDGKAELVAVSARMRRRDRSQDLDRARRRTLFVFLRGHGVRQAELARLAGVTDMAVKFAIADAEKATT